jgi:hypothetical protein
MPRFLRTAGFGSVLAFHLFIGGTVLSALLNPLLWIVFLFIVFSGPDGPGDPLACVSGASLIVSNGLLTILAMAGSRSSGDPRLAPHGLMVAAYWLLVSIAAYRGLWHLFTRPFHWEKTAHGLNPAHGVRHG